MRKSSILIFVICLLGILMACKLFTPTPADNSDSENKSTSVTASPAATSPTKLPTNLPVQTLTPNSARLPGQLDRSNFLSVVQWVSFLIQQNQPALISDVIGQNGVQFWGYAMGAEFLGKNNATFIVTELEKALRTSSPQCLGYNPDFGSMPDKAILFYKDLNFDWPGLGFGDNKSDTVGLQFFRMEQGWELVYITPIPAEFWPELKNTTTKCP